MNIKTVAPLSFVVKQAQRGNSDDAQLDTERQESWFEWHYPHNRHTHRK